VPFDVGKQTVLLSELELALTGGAVDGLSSPGFLRMLNVVQHEQMARSTATVLSEFPAGAADLNASSVCLYECPPARSGCLAIHVSSRPSVRPPVSDRVALLRWPALDEGALCDCT
jgi:hypothetical protein